MKFMKTEELEVLVKKGEAHHLLNFSDIVLLRKENHYNIYFKVPFRNEYKLIGKHKYEKTDIVV